MLRALAPLLLGLAIAPPARGQDAAAAPAAPRLEVARTLVLPLGVVNAAAFAPNGRCLCSADEAGDLILWDVRTGALQWRLHTRDLALAGIAWPLAGESVAVLGRK